MSVRIITGDALTVLRGLESESVQVCVTSPPYYALRDYGVDGQIGLESTPTAFLEALWSVFDEVRRVLRKDATLWVNLGDSYAGSGKGPTGHNGIGDQGQRQGFTGVSERSTLRGSKGVPRTDQVAQAVHGTVGAVNGLPAKNLLLLPERFAIGMQDRGWRVRSRIAWCKTSAMPESVRDRPTSAWEHIFLFAKSPRYFWDSEAVRGGPEQIRTWEPRVVDRPNLSDDLVALLDHLWFETSRIEGIHAPIAPGAHDRWLHTICVRLAPSILDLSQTEDQVGLTGLDAQIRTNGSQSFYGDLTRDFPVMERAARSARRWLALQDSAEQFVTELHGLGLALSDHEKLREARRQALLDVLRMDADGDGTVRVNDASKVGEISVFHDIDHTLLAGRSSANLRNYWVLGPEPSRLQHYAGFPTAIPRICILAGSRKGDTVLDPFLGSGTTALVADRLGRHAVGIELNQAYAEMARRRIENDAGPMLEPDIQVIAEQPSLWESIL